MHSRELIELAGLLSTHGPVLVHSTPQLSASGTQQYWTASKCRLDRWARSLRTFADDARHLDARALRVQWPFIRSVLEEILTGEVLTRVWTALLCLCDRRHGTQEGEAIGRSVMIGHLEARHRVLMLLIQGPGIDAEGAVKINRLRRRAERWIDLLVGRLAGLGDVSEFSVDADRAKDFAQDLNDSGQARAGRQAWPLMLASLQMAFRQGLSPISPNADLNAKIAASILACFPGDLFDSTGLFRSLWLTRLSNLTTDVEGMIEGLLAPEPTLGSPPGRLRRFGMP